MPARLPRTRPHYVASSRERLRDVRIPLLVVHARDDPLERVADTPEAWARHENHTTLADYLRAARDLTTPLLRAWHATPRNGGGSGARRRRTAERRAS